MKLTTTLTTLCALAMLATSAQATKLVGSINLGPYFSDVTIDKVTNSVTFNLTGGNPGPENAEVTSATGVLLDFVNAFPSDTVATYNDFTYDPLVVVNPIWATETGLEFSLVQVTSINESGSGLVLNGFGNLSAPGYTTTAGQWSFSADSSGSSFSFSSTATSVPDGGTSAALLGVSLLGLAGARRKFAR